MASLLILVGPTAGLPAVVPEPNPPSPFGTPPLTPEQVLAQAAPAYDAPMTGYLDLAGVVLSLPGAGDLEWATFATRLAEAHNEAVQTLTQQSSPGHDTLAALLDMRTAATDMAARDTHDPIGLLRGQAFAPTDDALDRLAAATLAAEALRDGAPRDATGALQTAGSTLAAIGAATDLAMERGRYEDAVAVHAAADQSAGPTAKAAAVLALQRGHTAAPPVAFIADPQEAAFALYQAAGTEPTSHQRTGLAQFGHLDPTTAAVLAHTLHAHRVQLAATAEALRASPPDLDAMLAGRLAAVQVLAGIDFQAASCFAGMADNTSAVFSYDLSCVDSWYDMDSQFVLDLAGADTYRNNAGGTGPDGAGFTAAMLIDAAGADRYLALNPPSGGYIGSGHGGSGFLLDAGGDDTYEAHAGWSTLAAIGSAYATAAATGLLIDGGGNDTYHATSNVDLAANGGAVAAAQNATAALIDLGGRDTYRVTHAGAYANLAANGAALGTFGAPTQGDPERHAAALLADHGTGTDVYDVQGTFLRTSANGGGIDTGRGLLLDTGGNDTYRAWSRFFGALNGGGLGGRTYANVGGQDLTTPAVGVGALIDLGNGMDHYNATIDQGEHAVGGVNGAGAIRGSGFLLDGGGDDRYDALLAPGGWDLGNIQGAANGAAADGGTGVLVDLGGSDSYDARLVAGPYGIVWGAANGAACGLSEALAATYSDCVWSGAPNPTAAVLLDLGTGDDSYRANITGGFTGRYDETAFGAANGGATDAHAILFDGGGNDTYWGRIGDGRFNESALVYPQGYGAIGGAAYRRGAALLVDVAGNDVHDARVLDGAVNGAAARVLLDVSSPPTADQAAVATGVLLDGSGNDSYTAKVASGAANGGGLAGAAALLDGGGDDRYDAEVLAMGGANGGAGPFGAALLVDAAGTDRYTARGHAFAGLNGGAGGFTPSGGEQLGEQPYAAAVLVDRSGNDVYAAEIRPTHPLAVAIGYVLGAANGAGALGSGILVDGAGEDVYACLIEGYGALNGSGFSGQGTLLDARGNDTYDASVAAADAGAWGAANGAAVQGLGVLVDGAGNDHYRGTVSAERDPFTGGAYGAANGAALVGGGLLVDGDGANTFQAALGGTGATNGAAGGFLPDLPGWLDNLSHLAGTFASSVPQAVGLLLGGTGDDVYESNGVTQGAADAYGLGVLLEPLGNDTYTAGPLALAQGAARHGGSGLLADLAGDGTFNLLADSFGQGYAVQGVGVLLQADANAEAKVSVDLTAVVGTTTGAGIGMRLVLGIGDLVVEPPTCAASYEILDINDTTEERIFKVCGPNEGSSVYIIDPRTGAPMEDQSKPPVPCGDGSVPLGEECGDTVEALLGPDADDWLRSNALSMRTSGGLSLTMVGAANPADRILYGEYYINMIDDQCAYSCVVMEYIFVED